MEPVLFFKRYLKEIGFYSKFLEYLKKKYCENKYEKVMPLLDKLTIVDLFYVTQCLSKHYSLNWFYESRTLSLFLFDYCGININSGDRITTKKEGYVVKYVRFGAEEVVTTNDTHVKFNSIKKINGKKCNLTNYLENGKEKLL